MLAPQLAKTIDSCRLRQVILLVMFETVSIDLARTGVNKADTALAAGAGDVGGRHGVASHRLRRVILRNEATCPRGKVNNDVRPLGVEPPTDDIISAREVAVLPVDAEHVVPSGLQSGHEIRADETPGASDQNSH